MTATIRKPVTSPAAVLAKSTVRAGALLGLSNGELARIIGVSRATVSRYKSGTTGLAPESKPGQLALLLVRVLRSLDPLVGADGEMRKAWMQTHNRALNGVPAALLLRPDGLVRTLAYLDGMRAAA